MSETTSSVRGGRPGDQVWELWFPGAGATGLAFARALVAADAAAGRVLVHAAPSPLDVVVRDAVSGAPLAQARALERHEPGPMATLVVEDDRVRLLDGWPTDEDLGRLVILPGGETGVLRSWWHAEDRSEWTWQVEFHNAR